MARRIVRGLAESATTGDRIKVLEAMRDLLAARLQATDDDRSVAPISKRLSEVMAELEALQPPKVKSDVDDLRSQREKRRAKVQDDATGSVQRGGRSGAATGDGTPPT